MLILLLLVIASILLGFLIDDRKSFFGNLLAELAGNAFAILAGLFLVQRLLKHHRDQQLTRVRHYALKEIAAHLCDISSRIPEYFPIQDPSSVARILRGRDKFHDATVRGFEDLLEQLYQCTLNDLGNKSISDRASDF